MICFRQNGRRRRRPYHGLGFYRRHLSWLVGLIVGCTNPDGLPKSAVHDTTPALLAVPPLVGRPTTDSATLGIVAGEQAVELEIRLTPPGETPPLAPLASAETRDVRLTDLTPGTEYRFEIIARAGARTETSTGRFVTQRPPGSSFSFALLADTHLPVPAPEWFDAASSELFRLEIYDYLAARRDIGHDILQTMSSIRARRVDFIVGLGDMLHFYRGFNDPFPSSAIATYGYLDLRMHLGAATAEAAFFGVIGNWEGESGWQPERLRAHAREARLKYLLNPNQATYPEGGSRHEDYYAWTWGDALLVVLNVLSYTPTKHTMSPDDDGTASDWTLGRDQLAWLEATLAASDERFKILFIHHPVGGRGGDEENSAYGRGGGRAAGVGEQAAVHRLMLDHGVQLFFYGHDHVFTDMVVDGIHYTLPGSAGAPWKFETEETGYDEYDGASGFGIVHVGPEQIEVELVDLAGEILRSYSVAANRS